MATLAATALLAAGTPAQAALDAAERQALVDFYWATGGSGWTKNTNWTVNDPTSEPCHISDLWGGLTCSDGNPQHVTELRLKESGLTGSLPDLTVFPQLSAFNVEGNSLEGPIPNLPVSLTYFRANKNQLDGFPPNFSSLSKLETFNVSNNSLTGPIPELPNLLNQFSANNNQLTKMPDSFPASLEYFYVSNNNMAGEKIPDALTTSSLKTFEAQDNKLTGKIPDFPESLTSFWVGGNELTGLPPEPKNVEQGSLCSNHLDPRSSNPARAAAWDAAVSDIWPDDASCRVPSYTVTGAADPADGGTFTCDPVTVTHGGGTECTAAAKDGYIFKEATLSDTTIASIDGCPGGKCAVSGVTGDVTVTATFTASC